jgi:hypothetical protein
MSQHAVLQLRKGLVGLAAGIHQKQQAEMLRIEFYATREWFERMRCTKEDSLGGRSGKTGLRSLLTRLSIGEQYYRALRLIFIPFPRRILDSLPEQHWRLDDSP